MTARKHKRKVFKLAKGNWGGRKNRNRMAQETVQKGLAYAHRDRRQRKREFRKMWIARLNAAARIHGLSYSRLIDGLTKAKVAINRKMLAELAIHDSQVFGQVVDVAKKQLSKA